MCSARLSWRSPPRLSRCRWSGRLRRGSGRRRRAGRTQASERTRPECDQATISWAATIGPTPGSSSSRVRARGRERGSRARARRLRRSRLDPAGEAAQDDPHRELIGALPLERRRRLQRSSSLLTGIPRSSWRSRSGRSRSRCAADERFAADIDGAAAGDQEQPQRFPSPTCARQASVSRQAPPVLSAPRRARRPCRADAARPRLRLISSTVSPRSRR